MNNRTHMCGEVTAEVAGQSVILKGWVQRGTQPGRHRVRLAARSHRHCASSL